MSVSADMFSGNWLTYAFGLMIFIVIVWAFFIVRRRMQG
jgi:hypothetical protein